MQGPMYLFVQSANSGTFENIEGGIYILTLADVNEDVIYFTDRSVREVGKDAF